MQIATYVVSYTVNGTTALFIVTKQIIVWLTYIFIYVSTNCIAVEARCKKQICAEKSEYNPYVRLLNFTESKHGNKTIW
jgi:hypothetical protein